MKLMEVPLFNSHLFNTQECDCHLQCVVQYPMELETQPVLKKATIY